MDFAQYNTLSILGNYERCKENVSSLNTWEIFLPTSATCQTAAIRQYFLSFRLQKHCLTIGKNRETEWGYVCTLASSPGRVFFPTSGNLILWGLLLHFVFYLLTQKCIAAASIHVRYPSLMRYRLIFPLLLSLAVAPN